MPDKAVEALARVAKALAPLPEDVQEDMISKIEFGVDMFNAGRQHERAQAGQSSV